MKNDRHNPAARQIIFPVAVDVTFAHQPLAPTGQMTTQFRILVTGKYVANIIPGRHKLA